uniref:Uncharacterized protein n=1 Tax=Anopheles melas TaxID=34690 RepID=A0A182U9P5_9DIPT
MTQYRRWQMVDKARLRTVKTCRGMCGSSLPPSCCSARVHRHSTPSALPTSTRTSRRRCLPCIWAFTTRWRWLDRLPAMSSVASCCSSTPICSSSMLPLD